MKYDPIMCMNIPNPNYVKSNDKKTVDASFNVVYKSNAGTMQALVMAANEKEAEQKVRSREGSKFVSLIGVRKMSDLNTLDKAIRNCDYVYGTAEIKDVNGKWVVFYSGRYVQEFDNSDDAESFVREKGWH